MNISKYIRLPYLQISKSHVGHEVYLNWLEIHRFYKTFNHAQIQFRN